MTSSYDSNLVGLGAIGSATVCQLARRGQRVLGPEMFELGHDQGSSHGHHRMIRASSLQDDGYVPLATRAFELWAELADLTGQELLRTIGEVRLIDPARDERVAANAAELARRGLVEILDEAALRERYPGFRLYEGMLATYEANAGFLWSERGILAHVTVARQHGASIRTGEA